MSETTELKRGRGNYIRSAEQTQRQREHMRKVALDAKARRLRVIETIKAEAKAEAIPRLQEAIQEVEKEIMVSEAYQGANEVKKTELLRDVGLSVIKKIHMLWDVCDVSQKTLKLYSQWFVKPLAQIMEQSRKSNLDVYEMKYGKKVVMEKREGTLEEWILGVKNVTPKQEEENENRGGDVSIGKRTIKGKSQETERELPQRNQENTK